MLLIVGVVQDVRIDAPRSGAGGETYTPRTLILDVGGEYPEYVELAGKALGGFSPVKGESVALEVWTVAVARDSRVFVNLKALRVADLSMLAGEFAASSPRAV